MFGLILASALVGALPASESADWEATLRRVVPSVVVLRVSATRPFDTENPGTYTATGFVVDAERGLILTNRHVVGPGPVVAEAVLQNHEELELRAVYRDPDSRIEVVRQILDREPDPHTLERFALRTNNDRRLRQRGSIEPVVPADHLEHPRGLAG